MPVLVTAVDLATHLNQAINRAPAEQILDMVEALVLHTYGSPTPPADPLPLQILRSVVLAAATRAYTNPEQMTSETVGPYSYQRQGGMQLTAEEKEAVRTAAGGYNPRGVVSVPLTTPTQITGPVLGWPW